MVGEGREEGVKLLSRFTAWMTGRIRSGQRDELWFGCVQWKVPVDFLVGVSSKQLATRGSSSGRRSTFQNDEPAANPRHFTDSVSNAHSNPSAEQMKQTPSYTTFQRSPGQLVTCGGRI